MANDLNITFSNFGNDADKYFLDDPIVYVRELGAATDPVAIGYMKIGKVFRARVDYASVYTGIPQTMRRKDPIKQDFELDGELYQFSLENFALAFNRIIDVVNGRVVFGSSIPNPLYMNMVLAAYNKERTLIELYGRKFQMATEEVAITLGGTEHSTIPFKGVFLPSDNPATDCSGWDYDSSISNDDVLYWKFTEET
jgi:hypothetical protein